MKYSENLVLIAAICLSQITSGQKAGKESDKLVTITGKVFNMDHKPVEGAAFYIDNIKTSFTSKYNGSYKIKVSPSSLKLEVRSAEYGFSEVLINGQTSIDFTLPGNPVNPDSKPGDAGEAKVTAGSRAKKMNTYANIYQMIRGEVSGVVVSGRSIQIQQGHSFFGSSTPLFVVNGVKVPSIDNINPIEVKSITVLKGSAASIYGIEGTNGVLSITLINGSEKAK